MSGHTGVLLLTFGSAVTSRDVPAYLSSVRGGRAVPDDVLREFQRRYDAIGRSPLLDITTQQADALQRELDRQHGAGAFHVEAGMLHSEPRAAAAIDALLGSGARTIIGVVLAPQYSPIILTGYERVVAGARERNPGADIRLAGAWHRTPEWIDSLAERVDEALASLPGERRSTIPIVFTAHSLPRPVVERDPGYIEQLRETARLVADRAALAGERWQFAYQSAGHTPEEWLTPDVKDLLPGLRAAGHDALLVVPVQFLADHLEILYDIDVAARDEAAALGMELHRIEMPNASPALIRALAAVVRRELSAPQTAVEDAVVGERG